MEIEAERHMGRRDRQGRRERERWYLPFAYALMKAKES